MPKTKDTWHICWHDLFEYDESSPTFLRWMIDIPYYGAKRLKVAKGDVAGSISTGRGFVTVSQTRYNIARIVHEMTLGPLTPKLIIDHKDGNPLNNQSSNLRAVTHKVNSHNMRLSKRNTSGAKGVTKHTVLDRNGVTVRYYWTAGWCDGGNYHCKSFSVSKLGEELAFKLACEYRQRMLLRLNEQGAGYTERHFND